MPDIRSQWNEYIGISNTTITDGVSPIIEAYVPEFIPNETNNLSETTELSASVTNPFDGVTSKSKVTRSPTITCVFLGASNTLIPCVAAGERVRILNYGGTETYYWLPMGRDPGLRLHERVRLFAMSQPSSVQGGSYKDTTDGNSFFIEMNTNKGQKEIHIHSSMGDGEPYGYDMRIIPEKFIWEFKDNIGHELSLNSQKHRWFMTNPDKSSIEIIKEDININCNGTLNINAGTAINVKTPSYTLNADTQSINGTSRSESLSSISISSSSYSLTASACSYTGAHTFAGPNFTVGTGSGVVPVIIVFGSNAW